MKKQKYVRSTLALLLLMAFTGVTYAQSPVDFARQYGLFVHEQNKVDTVSFAKGVQVLESYFSGSPLKPSATYSFKPMTQRDFLIQFETKRRAENGETLELSDDELYYQAWLYARRHNLLPFVEMSYGNMQEFLYRYSVSQAHGGIAYYEGLVLSDAEINTERFKSITQVRNIQQELLHHKSKLVSLKRPTKTTATLIAKLDQNYRQFKALETGIVKLEHPLNKIADLPEDIRQKITDNNLNQVLSQLSYNYSSNNANRKHNLLEGIERLNGKVYQPGEQIDFLKELGSEGWGRYRYGWVINGGNEVWEFGGGLCGSATMAFGPSWMGGLEIVTRFSHSIYYRSLYPQIGLDATIYRGHKNLVMKNSTNSPILYYVKNDTEKQEVTVYLIGNAPYADIQIEGPIDLGRNNYKWVRRMTQFDGTVVEDELNTRYGAIH